MKYERILAEVRRMPWAVTEEMAFVIAGILSSRASGERPTDDEIEARVSARREERAAVRDGFAPRQGAVAIMSIVGVLLPRGEALNTSGAVSVQRLRSEFRQLASDDNIGALVLDIDSPGGSTGGVAEFGDS